VLRFRVGNEMRETRYWEDREGRLCRVCGWEIESWEHVLDSCSGGGGEGGLSRERVKMILEEGGGGEVWLRELERERGRVIGEQGGVSERYE